MAEVNYKLLVLDHDGRVLAEQSAANAADAERRAAFALTDKSVCAVGVYRYSRAAGFCTLSKTVFRRAVLFNWREEE